MRARRKIERFRLICKEFESEEELAEAINKSRNYVSIRMNGHKDFTFRDKKLALAFLHQPIEKMPEYFPEQEERKTA